MKNEAAAPEEGEFRKVWVESLKELVEAGAYRVDLQILAERLVEIDILGEQSINSPGLGGRL